MKIEEGKSYRTYGGQKAIIEGRVSWPIGGFRGHLDGDSRRVRVWASDGRHDLGYKDLDLVSEWTDEPTGPVRTVTRKEIVPGYFGRVKVAGAHPNGTAVRVRLSQGAIAEMTAPELRAAAATFIALAEALEDGK